MPFDFQHVTVLIPVCPMNNPCKTTGGFSHFSWLCTVCHINYVMLISWSHTPSTMLFLPHTCCLRGQQRSRVPTRSNCLEAEVNFQLNIDK